MMFQKVYDIKKNESRIETPIEHVNRILARLEDISREQPSTSNEGCPIEFEVQMLGVDYCSMMESLNIERETIKELDARAMKAMNQIKLIYQLT
ncbi:MAG: hypothetical protein AABW47_04920 [Nanoarchaeota archaeon]